MKQDSRTAPPLYQAGRFWEQINNDFADLIYAGALQNLRNQYLNRRFASLDPWCRQAYRSLLWLYYQRLKAVDTERFLDTACEPSEGGVADQELIHAGAMSIDFLQAVDETYRVLAAWQMSGRSGKPRLIIELGAGYGRLAYVFRRIVPDCSYVILDLPEALSCSASWLGRVLAEEAVPYSESRLMTRFTREALLSRKLWTLAAYQIEQIDRKSADAFINVHSLAEMPKAVIDNYFAKIDSLTSGVFYSKQRSVERNAADNFVVTLDSYPVRTSWHLLFLETSSLYENCFETAYAIA